MFTFIKKDGREVQVNAESVEAALELGWTPKSLDQMKEEMKAEAEKDAPKRGK